LAGHYQTEDRGGARGFSLVELLVALVILAVLVSIALNIDRAYLAVMQSDLRNFMTAQESYFSQYNAYAHSAGEISLSTH
jgi:prepilin-type N-terminal cleavage/methylation domain-containing protein